jgi:hypothetical protein
MRVIVVKRGQPGARGAGFVCNDVWVGSSGPSKTGLFVAARSWDAAAAAGVLGVRAELASELDRSGRTALEVCAGVDLRQRPDRVEASIRTAEALIGGGVAVDRVRVVDDDGEGFPVSALWYAVGYGRNVALVEYLIGAGASPDWCLWAAVYNDDAPMVAVLLAGGAPTELVVHGDTPLAYAVRLGRSSVVPVLVAAGADRSVTDGKGRSLLKLAGRAGLSGEVVAMLDDE